MPTIILANGTGAIRARDAYPRCPIASNSPERYTDGMMRIGIFADSHDHVDNVCRAVNVFNQQKCELVLFAGDFVSPLVIPPLRRLNCPLVACFGDNDGNRVGIAGGMRIVGDLAEPPVGLRTADGTRILLTHTVDMLRGLDGEFDVAVFAHSHRPDIRYDAQGRLHINPGETSGWTYRKPTVVILETEPLTARLVALPELPPRPAIAE